MPDLEDDYDVFPNEGIFSGAYDDKDKGAEADFNNMDNTIDVSPIHTLTIHKDHPKGQILGDPKSAVQTRGKIQKASSAQQALKISQALEDESWVEAMQEELLQFKLQKVWILIDLPYGKKAIGTKWVFRNKRDERGIVVKNKARLVTQGFRQEEGIDYDEVFVPVARIEAIMLFLAFASFMRFTVYQMDVKSAFLYGTIGEEVYVHQPPGFVDPTYPHKVYKVVKALYGVHQTPRAWYETLSTFLLENGFRRGTIDKTLFIKKNKSDIIQDKYVADILKKFDFYSIKIATTPIESNNPLVKDEDGVDVDVHVYRSMIGSLMYLTASRPDIMFVVCACARDSLFELEAFSDSDYRGASLDRKSTTVKNHVYHSRTKHIEIRHHFIRDCYEKRLIDVIKIHTDANVADLLTKGFDVTRFNFLVVSIGMLNLTSMNLRMDGSCAGSFSHIWSIKLKMANLRYSDKHNMVAFLKKPTESVGFTEIVDFLKGTSLRTLANMIQELVASIDNKEYTITEASIRSQLQLADAIGLINLSDAEIYKKDWPHWDMTTNHDGKYISPILTKEIFGNMKRGYAGEHVPLLPAMLAGAAKDQEPPHSSPPKSINRQDTEVPQPQGPTITFVADEETTTSVGVETEGAATTTSGLDAGMDSGNIHESPLRSHEAPLPEGNTSGSAEDSLQLKELMAIVPKMKVKSLEVALKRMSKRVILSDSEDEETENQGRKIQDIDDDPLVSLVRESMKEKEADFVTHIKASASGEAQEEDISPTILEAAQILSQVVSQSVNTYKKRARSATKGKEIGTGLDFFSAAKERLNFAEVEVNTEVNPGNAGVNTGNTPVSTPSVVQTVNVTIPSPVKDQREGKAPITAEDVQATQKIKAQIEQEKASLAEAMRLQALQDEEATRQVHLDALLAKRIQEEQELSEQQQKRKAEVQEAAQYYTEKDWDTIRAKLEANAELTKSLQGENVSSDDFAKRMVDMINQKK
ncbi:retrovirus-related pol polyprotein from transposon TNT 1-94 [Tanacetum coccineum]